MLVEIKDKKKIFIFVIIAIAIVSSFIFFIFFKVKYENNISKEQKEENQGLMDIKRFQDDKKTEDIDKYPEKHIFNSGGIDNSQELFIEGSHLLYNYYSYEKQKEIKDKINYVLKNKIIELKGLENKKMDLETYYNENMEELVDTFVTTNLKEFKKLLKKLDRFDYKSIEKCVIKEDTLKYIDGILTFKLVVSNKSDKEEITIDVINLEVDNQKIFNVIFNISGVKI